MDAILGTWGTEFTNWRRCSQHLNLWQHVCNLVRWSNQLIIGQAKRLNFFNLLFVYALSIPKIHRTLCI